MGKVAFTNKKMLLNVCAMECCSVIFYKKAKMNRLFGYKVL